MTDRGRKVSEGNVYHVISRGVGQQIIFEDEDDKLFFFSKLVEHVEKCHVKLFAWCLMDNHVHLLVRAPIENVSCCMLRVQSTYARYFNHRHERVGTLFQGRFTSVPIETENQLLAVVRYIHFNPVKAGGSLMYRWSSYSSYLGDLKGVSSTFVLDVLGGIGPFQEFHEMDMTAKSTLQALPSYPRHRMLQQEARAVAVEVLGDINPYEVKALPKPVRDQMLGRLCQSGLSTRQVARLVGVSQSVVARAANKVAVTHSDSFTPC